MTLGGHGSKAQCGYECVQAPIWKSEAPLVSAGQTAPPSSRRHTPSAVGEHACACDEDAHELKRPPVHQRHTPPYKSLQCRARFPQHLKEVDEDLSKSISKSCPMCPKTTGECRGKFRQCRAKSGRNCQKSSSLGHIRSKSTRIWPTPLQICHRVGRSRTRKSVEIELETVQSCPPLVKRGLGNRSKSIQI